MEFYRTPLHDRGFLNRWLILGAFPIPPESSAPGASAAPTRSDPDGWMGIGSHPLPLDSSRQVHLSTPLPGDTVRHGETTAVWTPCDAHPDHTLLLPPLFRIGNNCSAYLYTIVEANEVVTLRLRAERGAHVWVDGRPLALLYARNAKIAAAPAEGLFPMQWKPGRHEILIQCWQGRTAGMNGWGLQAQLLDVQGRPVHEGDLLLPMRKASDVRRMAFQARCGSISLSSDIPEAGKARLGLPDDIDRENLRVLLPEFDASWPVADDSTFGPMPAGTGDRIVKFHIEIRVPGEDTPAVIDRHAAILPPSSETKTDPRTAVLQAILGRQGSFESMVGLPPPPESISPAGLTAAYALGAPPKDPLAASRAALDFIDSRRDCADFRMLWLLRWRRLFGLQPEAQPLTREVEQRMIDFIYAPEDSDAHTMCMGTENHRAMFWACEILAGEALPDDVFSVTGHTGAWHAERARSGIREWMEEKLAFGYHEWGSHYLMVDLDVLCTLRDFCADADTASRANRLARKTLHLLVNDAWDGTLAGARSRAYAPELLWPGIHRTAADVFALLGDPLARPAGDPFAIGLATSCKPFPADIGARLNSPDPQVVRERQGKHAPILRTLYRTADGVLASASGYPQFGIMQRLHWWARLPGGISVFTTHPGPGTESSQHRPNYWSGTATAPTLGQVRSALLCRYDLTATDPWGYTHAFWPEQRFDESLAVNGWYMGRSGQGFIALRPLPRGLPTADGRYGGREIQASGHRTGWVCQMGSSASTGDFGAFVRAVRDAPVSFSGDRLVFRSPWEGELDLQGDGRLCHNGNAICPEASLHIDAPGLTWRWGEEEPCSGPTSF